MLSIDLQSILFFIYVGHFAQESLKNTSHVQSQLLNAIPSFLNEQRRQPNLSNHISDSRVCLRRDQKSGDRIILKGIHAKRDDNIVCIIRNDVLLDQLLQCLDVLVISGRKRQRNVDVEAQTFALACFRRCACEMRVDVTTMEGRVERVGCREKQFLRSVATKMQKADPNDASVSID